MDLEKIFDVPFTFSANCRSGLLERCECWRCRKSRNEEVTEETEKNAKIQASIADEDFRKRTAAILRQSRNRST